MSEIKKDEMEEAMEEGKTEVKPIISPSDNSSNKNTAMAAVGMLVALALVIGIPVGIMRNNRKSPKTLPPETLERFGLEIPDGKSKQPGLPIASFNTLKETYTSCTDLSNDLNIAVRMLANQTIESNIKSFFHSPYNNYGGGPFPIMFSRMDDVAAVATPEAAPVSMMADTASSSAADGAGAGGNIETSESSFGSNNQEEGVEEPDVLKSDGTSVYAAYGSEIVKLNVEDAQVLSRTQLPVEDDNNCNLNYISSMLLVDDTLAVISSGWCSDFKDDDEEETLIQPRSSIAWRPDTGSTVTRIVMYDKNTMELKEGEGPKFIKGNYNSARAIGNDIYVITTTSINYWTFTNKLNIWDRKAFGTNFTEDEYREMAVQKVLDTIDDFVAELTDDYFEDCASVQRLTLFQNEVTGALPPVGGIMESIATVTGFDVKAPALTTAKSLILPQSGWQVYSSQTQLVLATRGWWFGNGASQETYVITYSLADAEASVVGFGTVPGYVLNQYSIDHQNKNGKDYLLLATTTRESWAWTFDDEGERRTWEPRNNSTSQITVLEVPQEGGIESGKMEVVGKVEGLGKPGEQIYSVRFQNDRAFVVTFEQTDPFYTIDVADPENPSKVGELEIPGFSSYLHPIGENLIMGIGQYVNETTTRQEGLQISIFDVTDFANPEQIHTYVETSGDGSGSEAEYNPMAFRYLDETGLLILPVSVYSWRRFPRPADDETPFNGFKVYKADGEGISEYLRVNHETRDYYFYRYCWRNYQGNLAARSLVFSGMLWTMQGNAIQLSDLSTRVISAEPIDLDEGVEDVVSCRTPYNEFPMPIAIDVVEPVDEEDCSVAICKVAECEEETPVTPEGECCPVCPSDIVEEEELEEPLIDCAAVSCAIPLCADDEVPFTPEGTCCPACPSDITDPIVDFGLESVNVTDVIVDSGLDCSSTICAVVRCVDDETPVTPKGECCSTCPSGNFETGLDCSTVRCAMPECSQPTIIPEGECCPKCPEEEEEEPEE